MKNKLTIFGNKKIQAFLIQLFSEYDLFFMSLDDLNHEEKNSNMNIIFLNDQNDMNLLNLNDLNNNYLILSKFKSSKIDLDNKCKYLQTPVSINNIKNIIENFVENLSIKYHDISIANETLTNINNKSFCYLTKVESEILSYLIKEKEVSKTYIKENFLKIKSNIETNALESHLTRIRKKMGKIKTTIKIKTRNEKLLIST